MIGAMTIIGNYQSAASYLSTRHARILLKCIFATFITSVICVDTHSATSEPSSAERESVGFFHSFKKELRLPVGAALSNPEQLNTDVNELHQVRNVLTFGIDALVILNKDLKQESNSPIWSVGLRFNSLSSIKYDKESHFEVAAHDFGLFTRAQYRLPGRDLSLGPYSNLGVFTPVYVIRRESNSGYQQFKASDVKSLAVGIEAIWNPDVYVLGSQIGYQYLVARNFLDQSGQSLSAALGGSPDRNADLSGMQFNAFIGLRF
jgi:hypothetical protein